jgi:hypothetical protein
LSIPWRSVFPFEAFPANVGVIDIAASDIILIDIVPIIVPIIVVFGLNAFVSIFVLYVTAIEIVIAIVVTVIIAFCLDAFVPIFAFHIAAVHIGKACGGQREYQCEYNQKGFHGRLESSMR